MQRGESSDSGVFSCGRYKLWVLAAIPRLAFWSIYTGNLNRFSDNLNALIRDDLDVLEMEKLVKHMWDVYTNSRWMRVHEFWQEVFKAAFEDLSSDERWRQHGGKH